MHLLDELQFVQQLDVQCDKRVLENYNLNALEYFKYYFMKCSAGFVCGSVPILKKPYGNSVV